MTVSAIGNKGRKTSESNPFGSRLRFYPENQANNKTMKTNKLNRLIHRTQLLILAAAAVGLSGCASIVDGRTPKISINSKPAGAKVSVLDKADNRVLTGTTPFV